MKFIKSHLKLIGLALILSAAVLGTILAVGTLRETPQAEQQKSESMQTAVIDNPVIDNPAVNSTGISSESEFNPTTKPTIESTLPAQENSNPIPAAVPENSIVNRARVSDKPGFNRPAPKAKSETKETEEMDQLFSTNTEAQSFSFGDDLLNRAQKNEKAEHDEDKKIGTNPRRTGIASDTGKPIDRKPRESKLKKAGRSFDGDLRVLPYRRPKAKQKPERGEPSFNPRFVGTPPADANATESAVPEADPKINAAPEAAAPAPIMNFDGLDRQNWGSGSPSDPNGDVGPNHYIQSVNSSVGIYDKTTGALITAFTFDTLMSQGNFGNLCDTDNFGDPVVLYDTFEDRWILTDFAFQLDAGQNVVNPPGAFECFAVSKTSDPVSGGWNFYSINTEGGLGDYPKFGVWTDGLYMTTSMFDYAAGGGFQNARVYAFNKAQMYAGSPTVQVVSFNLPPGDFTVIPSNARLQTGTPPPGTPNYFVSTWQFLNALSVYKFHVDWNSISLSTFSTAEVPLAASGWPNASVANAPQSGTATTLDVLQIRAMMQNQYTNIGGVESLWNTHTVRRANTTGFAAPRWYQLNVTGGTIAPNILQAVTWDPDGANVMHRFMPSLAVDRAGNMALGYSTSSSTTFPSIKYAGRLSTDALNTFSQTEQTLLAGTASQTTSSRWGDYSAMTVDPNGCTFWFTSQYANPASQAANMRWLTRIGSFQFAECTPIGNGALDGTVTVSGNPLSGATVSLGTRTATTDINGYYSFTDLPAGTYPNATASAPGYGSSSVNSIVINENATTTQNFSLIAAPDDACLTDTTQSDFLNGVPTNVDLNTSPGDVRLTNPDVIDQQNTSLGTQGAGFNTTTWLGQTFTPAVTGPVTRVDINFFSLNCGAVTMPNITVSIRNASGNLPTGADLATATITGFCNGAGGNFTAIFATPVTLTAGTQYALVWRAAAAIPAGAPAPGYFATVSAGTGATALQNPYAGGRRTSSSNSGSTWAGAAGNANNDHGFKIYVNNGFTPSGNLVSSTKDANPAVGSTALWDTISWNATTPANTDIQFQVAASNNLFGPFNFVGPDGTAGTFFSNGASLSQFDGLRYLRYKATLSTTDGAVTPTLHDVTICFNNVINTTLTVAPSTGTYGGTVNLSATLTDGTNGISGKSIDFTLNAVSVGNAVTDANGVATLSNVSLAGINAGSYPTGVGASFAGDASYGTSAGTNSLTVNKADQIIMFGALADKTTADPPFMVSATGGASGNPVTFSAGGNCTSGGTNGSTITITGAGSCTVTASQLGNSNYNDATPVMQSFNIFVPNNPPTANPDSYSTVQNTPLNVAAPGVLSNDSDPDAGNTITAVLVSGPANAASFALNADGSFNYTPTAGFTGTDSFTYQARDNLNADSGVVTVTLNVRYRFDWFYYSNLLLSEQVLNQVTAGSNVPVRFTLYGYKGDPYSMAPTSQQINCATFAPVGAATTINRFTPDPFYTALYDFYQTTWQTQGAWKFTCRELTLHLNDGTTRKLKFYFK